MEKQTNSHTKEVKQARNVQENQICITVAASVSC